MSNKYLHQHKDFPALLRIIEDETSIQAGLIEKDYWIMHVLFGLKKQGFSFKLKGGTSLSKGYKIINRFSEDIDIYIKPPEGRGVNENPKNSKTGSVKSRKEFYDWLATEIKIDGITSVKRDHTFDDPDAYRSGGIRLQYESTTSAMKGVKEGILLEAGFDTVSPNESLTISSWAFDKAIKNQGLQIIDNRATEISCYDPGYTFVEKLQTIATKFRKEHEGENARSNFMRQYYDVYCLLGNEKVQAFIGTTDYEAHKKVRFPKTDLVIPIANNEAFIVSNSEIKKSFIERYKSTAALYYQGQPDFEDLLKRIKDNIERL